jgi:aminopeptidase 2
LSLLTVGADGKPKIQKDIVLDTREKEIELDTSKPFKLNAGTVTPGELCPLM